jgi:CheY-like chemotaxis protein
MLTRAAHSGSEALDWLRQGEPFDLAILDMQMPEMDGLKLAAEIRKLPGCQNLLLVMLTSIGKPETRDPGVKDNFDAILTKPIKQSQLYDVLMEVLVGQPIKVLPSSNSSEIDSHLAERLPLRILLAEDNLVNQQVALHILQRMGYRADVAGNGLEVLEALSRQPYDVVLMDVQMPEMDGLTATRRIVSELPLQKRPWIIAMTANAMLGDREMCLEAGMDDYISKPIRVEEVVRALSKCQEAKETKGAWSPYEELGAGEEGRGGTVHSSISNSTAVPVLDATAFQQLREMVNQDEILVQIVDRFLEETPSSLRSLAEAVSQRKVDVLKRIAHTLKSTTAMFGATSLSQLCQKLEAIAPTASPDSTDAIVSQVEIEYENVQIALRQHCQQLMSRL